MTDRIIEALGRCGISRWRINEKVEESAELFFVKHELDTRRIKDTHKFSVTVFRRAEADGKAMVGKTAVELIPSMTDAQIDGALNGAYYAAGFALNPDYEAPAPVRRETVFKAGELASAPLQQSAGKMAAAALAADTRKESFINSLEVFCHRTFNRVISSEGTDVSYTDAVCKGEYVVQCKEPEDVELFAQFEYGDCDAASLTQRVGEDLRFAADRARAQSILKSGSYDVVLSGVNLVTVLEYYAEKSSADMIYPKYSQWKTGDDVQGCSGGDAVSISLDARVPFSSDGIPMKRLKLMEDGRLSAIHGRTDFCRYLGIEPTGEYGRLICENPGSASFEELKSGPCLWPVVFSDFQMDSFSGHFGGEIRLAYLIEDGRAVPVTGGSVNGILIDAQRDMVFSRERYSSAFYEGPYAARFRGIPVAGTAD
jgi:predicted Zn-dependent protease